MLGTVCIFIITISILVTVHEFGHFIIARLCGVKVECFSVGFGKKILSYKSKSGTEFTIALIPLGGYVKMQDSRLQQLTDDEKIYAYDCKKIWQKTLIVCAGPIANFLLAGFIYWIVFQIGVMTYPVKIEKVLPDTPVANFSIPTNAEIKTFNGKKVESWNDVNLALIASIGKEQVSFSYVDHLPSSETREVTTTVDIKNWRVDLEKESVIKQFGFQPKSLAIYPIISRIVKGSAAEKAGLKVNDEIIGYDNHPYVSWNDFTAVIKQGNAISLTVKRAEKIINVNLVPIRDNNGEGIAGLYPTSSAVITKYGILGAIDKSITQTLLTIELTVRSLYQLITGVISLNNLSGPLTIAKSAGQTASYGIVAYLYFLGFISISLGVINLVPLPMLDGGHLLFLLIEKIKGKALSESTTAICYRVGSVVLLALMGIAIFNDFLRL